MQLALERDASFVASDRMDNGAASHPSILLIAGDVSGDVHAAALARAVLAHDPNRSIHALGGKRLRRVVAQSPGGHFLADTEHSSAIGLISSILLYFRCWKLRDRLRKFINQHQVDLAILCDWGGFNGRIISELHERRIPVLYYFPPRSWRRSGARALGIVPYVTRVATPFPWSAETLQKAGVQAEWVGHPAIENIAQDREGLRKKFAVQPNERLIALLPGSRRTEIRVLAKRMAEAAEIINAQEKRARFIAVVPEELATEARSFLPPTIQIVSGNARELLAAADAAIVKSGTGTLEAVAAGVPQVTIYDAAWIGRLEWLVLWSWRWFRFIAMPNIIAQREIVPELIGLQCRPEKLAGAVLRLLNDPVAREKMLAEYSLVRQTLGSELPLPASERTAQIVDEMLEQARRRFDSKPVTV